MPFVVQARSKRRRSLLEAIRIGYRADEFELSCTGKLLDDAATLRAGILCFDIESDFGGFIEGFPDASILYSGALCSSSMAPTGRVPR